jgi:gliding motility-associated-like protein
VKQKVNNKINIINRLAFKRSILLLIVVLFISVDAFAKLRANFTASPDVICDGSSVTFTDISTGTSDETEYYWDFGSGASPESATGVGPHLVTYSGPGKKTVKLTIEDEDEDEDDEDDIEKEITVYALPELPEVIVTDNCNSTSTLSTIAEGTLLWSTMETSSSITVAIPGIYTVITTIDGCTSDPGSGTAAPKTTPETPVVTVVDNCDGTSTLSTDAEGALLWSTTETTSSITVSVADIYTVTTTIDDCTSLPGSGTAAPKAAPAVPIVTVVENCDGTSTLSTDSEGALLWSTAETTSSITVSVPDIYTVTTTIDDCTSLPGSGTAAPKTAPAAPIVTVVDNCDGTSTLSTDAEGALLWSTAETTSSITVSVADIYTVTTTIDGCTSLPGSGTAAPKTALAAPAVTVVDNCNGTSTLSTDAAGALLWSTGATVSSITVSSAGIYTVTTTIDRCTSLPGSGTAAPKTIPAAPIVTVVDNCGGTSTLSTDAAGVLLWSTAETTSSITVSVAGIYTVTTSIDGCTSLPGSGTAAPKTNPSAPVVGVILQPTCTVSTGAVELNGLPSGTWTINPGSISGTTVSKTITGLAPGTYLFTVTNSSGCTSTVSSAVIINAQPVIPAPPQVGKITQPSCDLSTGSVELNGLIETGIWTLTRYPGTVILTGTGKSTTISGLPAGTYNFTIANAAGCVSVPSANVIINAQPLSPAAPAQITDCTLGFDKAVVTVTSPVGPGLEYSIDGGKFTTSTSFTNQKNGTHVITVRNAAGCITSGVDFSISCGCSDPPIITLGSVSGNTCGTSAVTVSNNLISGSATKVTLTTNGGGTISPASANVSPFSFTYTPSRSDTGKTIIISLKTDNPLGSPCAEGTGIYTLTVNSGPSAPIPGVVTQMTCKEPTGSVILSGLPADGEWILNGNPGSLPVTGTGTSTTITGLLSGTYNYTVTNSAGCISELSMNIVIHVQPSTVTLVITNPPSLCSPGKADLTSPSVTAGSTQGITYAYYTDAAATISYPTPSGADNGIYYIRGTSAEGCFDIKPVAVTVMQAPVADAGPDKILDNQFETFMEADLTRINDTGTWSVIAGTGEFSDENDAKTSVSGLSINENKFIWTVRNEICPAASDTVSITVSITVSNQKIQTLITPNMDGRNDYFELKGLESMGRTELLVFDRRGVQVFKNANYDNLWNGVDYNGNPLHDDTYFYVLRTENGKIVNGFIVIRR